MNVTTVNISFGKKLLEDLDAIAEEEDRNRSELIRAAITMYLERKRRWQQLTKIARLQAKKQKLTPDDIDEAIRTHRKGHHSK